MKPHLIVKLREATSARPTVHWTAIVDDKSGVTEQLMPAVDRLLSRFDVRVWVTSEYEPSGEDWSPVERQSGLDRIYRLIRQSDEPIPPDLIDRLSTVPEVEYVRPVHVGAAPLPDPSLAAALAAKSDWARDMVYLEEAHRFSRGDPAVTIAILDTGVSGAHPEYEERLRAGRDFVHIIDGAEQFMGDFLEVDSDPDDEVGHGTHVAGILAAQGTRMPVGVVPRCEIVPVRVLAAMRQGNRRVGAGLVDNINVALKWVVDQEVDVVNMSLGIRHEGGGLPHEEVVNYARDRGVTIVAAAGNDGREELYYPGAFPHVISVGACERDGRVAPFSTYGKVDFVAPGTDIYSTYLDREYAFSSGTSHAAPFVTGAVALLKSLARQRGYRLEDRQVKHLLHHTADKIGRAFRHRRAGFGRVNYADALRLLHYKLN